MKKIKYFCLSLLVIILCNNLTYSIEAQENTNKNITIEKQNTEIKQSLNLNDCIKLALKNSPVVKKSKYDYDISKKSVSIAKSVYFPTIGAGTSYSYQTSKSDRSSTNSDNYNVEASLNQLIWNFGKTNSNIRIKKFNQITSLFNFDNTVLNTIFNVKTNYFGVLAAKANVDVAKSNVDINERNYLRTKAYFEEGIKSKIDLVNAEVYLSDAKVSLVKATNAYKNSLIKLNNSMYLAGNPEYNFIPTENFNIPEYVKKPEIDISSKKDISGLPEDVEDAFLISKVEKVELLTNYKFVPFQYSLEECLELAKKNRPDLKAYNSTLDAIKEQLVYTKREYFPELRTNVGYGYRNQYNTNSLNVGINLNTSVNILAKKNEIDTAKIQVEIAENEVNLANQNIYFEVQNAYVDMIELEKQIPLQAIKVKHTLENLELADGRYAVGLGDYIELQDAKVNYNNAQQSYIMTVYNYNVARANLEKVIALEQETTIKIEEKI